MNKFDEVYNKIISQMNLNFTIDSLYNVSNLLIEEQKNTVFTLMKNTYPSKALSIPSQQIICQQTYFQQWDVNESCIDAVNNILKLILQKYKQTNNIEDLELRYSVKKLLSQIDYSTLSNFKNFHKFLDLLKQNAAGFITISIGKSDQFENKDSFYEPPIKFGFPPKNGMIVDSYYQYLEDETKNCKNWHQIINKIMKNLYELKDYGTINISASALHRGQENLKTNIAHEVSHFIKFLVRINGLNYNYGLNYSRKDLDYSNVQNYFSKPDQWKQLAATYIQQLRIMFDEIDIEHNFQNALKFIDTILYECQIPVEIKEPSTKQYKLFTKYFRNHFHYNDILKFIKVTYENSKSQNSIRNTWKVFKKFLNNQFKRRYKK